MRYVFFGTPRFAEIILRRLIEAGMPPAALVTNPDRPQGRKRTLTPPPAKTLVLRHSPQTKIYQPEKPREIIQELQELRADLFIVAAYAKIIPADVLRIPPRGTIGAHPSLLPKYRGASPIQSAILAGEHETGVSLYLLDERMDAGPVLSEEKIAIGETENYESLMERLAAVSGELLLRTPPLFLRSEIVPRPQDEAKSTYTKKFTAEDARVDLLRDDPREVLRKVRALNPEPGVWTEKDGKRMKILAAEIRDGELKLQKIQMEGKKPQTL